MALYINMSVFWSFSVLIERSYTFIYKLVVPCLCKQLTYIYRHTYIHTRTHNRNNNNMVRKYVFGLRIIMGRTTDLLPFMSGYKKKIR